LWSTKGLHICQDGEGCPFCMKPCASDKHASDSRIGHSSRQSRLPAPTAGRLSELRGVFLVALDSLLRHVMRVTRNTYFQPLHLSVICTSSSDTTILMV